jgi:hypothetical protein
MAVADQPIGAPLAYRQAWLLARFLGLSLAAVAAGVLPVPEVKVECPQACVTPGGGGCVTPGAGGYVSPGGRRCELKLGRLRVPLPPSTGA